VAARTTRITVETETLVVIRRAKAILAWCPGCLATAETITLDADSLADPATAEQLQAWLATGQLHHWHTPDGAQICVRSLLRCFDLRDV
jgi:hypothetical protein